MGMNKEQDELLLAWLVKNKYMVYHWVDGLVLTKCVPVGDENIEKVRLSHISMWASSSTDVNSEYIWLYKEQRGKRKPLRSLLWGLVLGL